MLDASARFRNRTPHGEDGAVELTFLAPQSGATDYAGDLSATRRLERSRRVLLERVDRLTAEVIAIEDEFHVTSRWEPGDEQFMKTVEYINNRRYYCALGKVQRLVVQRLFELHRLNLAQTGKFASFSLFASLLDRTRVSSCPSSPSFTHFLMLPAMAPRWRAARVGFANASDL